MINDLKLGIKMFRYGRYLKAYMVWGGICFVIGMLINIWDRTCEMGGLPGDALMMLSGIFFAYNFYSLSGSGFLRSSSVPKRLQTSVPATGTCFFMVALYLVLALSNGIMMTGHPEYIGAICIGTLFSAVVAAFMMITAILPCKSFGMEIMQGTGISFLLCSEKFIVGKLRLVIFDNSAGSFALALVIGLFIIVLGGLGQYGVSLLVYRAPMRRDL